MYSFLVSDLNEPPSFCSVPERYVFGLMSSFPSKTCDLDPLPTRLLKECTDFVTPAITTLINLSLLTGVVPDEWKDSLILPGLKKRDFALIHENYCPIFNLPIVSNVCKKVVTSQITNHLLANKLMEPFQSAYKAGHSTETALLRVFNTFIAIDRKKVTFLALHDLSAAFDTIGHGLLLYRLNKRFGVIRTALPSFESYMSDRRQQVSINGNLSDPHLLKCGVPHARKCSWPPFVLGVHFSIRQHAGA